MNSYTLGAKNGRVSAQGSVMLVTVVYFYKLMFFSPGGLYGHLRIEFQGTILHGSTRQSEVMGVPPPRLVLLLIASRSTP